MKDIVTPGYLLKKIQILCISSQTPVPFSMFMSKCGQWQLNKKTFQKNMLTGVANNIKKGGASKWERWS